MENPSFFEAAKRAMAHAKASAGLAMNASQVDKSIAEYVRKSCKGLAESVRELERERLSRQQRQL